MYNIIIILSVSAAPPIHPLRTAAVNPEPYAITLELQYNTIIYTTINCVITTYLYSRESNLTHTMSVKHYCCCCCCFCYCYLLLLSVHTRYAENNTTLSILFLSKTTSRLDRLSTIVTLFNAWLYSFSPKKYFFLLKIFALYSPTVSLSSFWEALSQNYVFFI